MPFGSIEERFGTFSDYFVAVRLVGRVLHTP